MCRHPGIPGPCLRPPPPAGRPPGGATPDLVPFTMSKRQQRICSRFGSPWVCRPSGLVRTDTDRARLDGKDPDQDRDGRDRARRGGGGRHRLEGPTLPTLWAGRAASLLLATGHGGQA